MTKMILEIESWKLFSFLGIFTTYCLPDVNEASQRFREIPHNILVAEGANVELRCAVDDQKGRAQWAKDGFALGFVRNVPGYPRYHYKGNAAIGEHHLVISNVALEDDGEYQCQVGPTSEAEPIWASANVTVLVAPTSINIIGYKDGAVIEVPAQKPFAIECLIANARPAPAATWYRDGIQLSKSNQKDTMEGGIKPRLVSLRSRVILTAVPANDGQQFSCRGHHPALSEAPTALLSTVTISVLHPPRAPKISGYNGETLMTGAVIHLSCRSEGGVPRPKVSWYRHETLLDDSFILEEDAVVNDFDLKVSSQEDNAIIECRVFNGVTEYPLSASVALSVLYPPAGVHIEAPSVVSIGGKLELKCQSLPSNPKVQLRWIIENKRISSNLTMVKKIPLGGWVATSVLKNFQVGEETSRDGSHVTVLCEAVSPITDRVVSEEIVISIVRLPEPPLLDGFNNEIFKESKIPVSCYSRGGNPTPVMELHKGEELIRSEMRMYENVTEVYSEILVNESDNGKVITCKLIHPAHKEPVLVSHRLNVLFPPKHVLASATPVKAEVGEEVLLSCESSVSNPPTDLAWYSDGEQLQGGSQSILNSDQRGERTRSELVLVATVADDGRNYSCKGSNELEGIVEDTVTLQVLHYPLWLSVPAFRVSSVEGENISFTAVASGNPGPLRYEWNHDGKLVNNSEETLVFGNVTRHHSGFYYVTATSPRGSINSSFHFDVLFSPVITEIIDELKILSGMTDYIRCSAEGNPPPYVSWISVHSGAILSSGINSSTLEVKEATPSHTQEIICNASNDIGLPAVRGSRIIVEHGAFLLRNSGMSWISMGNDAFVLCHARAFPKPSFLWSSTTRSLGGNDKFYFTPSDSPILVDHLSLWVSVINISDYELNEEFKCVVQNSLGEDFGKIRLNDEASRGDLRILNTSSSSVTLQFDVYVQNFEQIHSFYVILIRLDDLTVQIKKFGNDTVFNVDKLQAGVAYVVTLYGSDENGPIHLVGPSLALTLGGSKGAITNSEDEKISSDSVALGGVKVPRLVLLITTLTGISLLVVNIALITCYLRSRKSDRSNSDSFCIMLKGQTFDDFDSTKDEVYLQVADKEPQNHKGIDRRNSLTAVVDKIENISLSEETFVHSERNKHSINYSPGLNNHVFALNSTPKLTYNRSESPIEFYPRNITPNQINKSASSPMCHTRLLPQNNFPNRTAQTSFTRNITPSSCRANIIHANYPSNIIPNQNTNVIFHKSDSSNITPNPIFHKSDSPLLQPKSLHSSPERRSKLEDINYQWGTSIKQLKPNAEEERGTISSKFHNQPANYERYYSQYPETHQGYPENYFSKMTNATMDPRVLNSRVPNTLVHHSAVVPSQMSYLESRGTIKGVVYPQSQQQQAIGVKKYSTLNPASLCELESKCGPHCYCSRFCPDSPCKYTYPRSIDCYATLGPNYRQSNNQYYSSLPRIKKSYEIYDNCYSCEECSHRNNRLKTAYSSHELNRCNVMQYQFRPFYASKEMAAGNGSKELVGRNGSMELAQRNSAFSGMPSTFKEEPLFRRTPDFAMSRTAENNRFNSIIKKINQDLGFNSLEYKPRSYEEVFNEDKFTPSSSNYVKRSKSFSANDPCTRYLQSNTNSLSNSQRSSCETIMKKSPNLTKSQSSKPVPSRVTFHISGNSDATSSDSPSHGLEPNSKDCNWSLTKKDDEKSASDFEEDENSTSSSTEETLSLKNQKFEAYYSNNTLLLQGNDPRNTPKLSADDYFR